MQVQPIMKQSIRYGSKFTRFDNSYCIYYAENTTDGLKLFNYESNLEVTLTVEEILAKDWMIVTNFMLNKTNRREGMDEAI